MPMINTRQNVPMINTRQNVPMINTRQNVPMTMRPSWMINDIITCIIVLTSYNHTKQRHVHPPVSHH